VPGDSPSVRDRWWREPLVHFVVLGVVLFALFNWRGAGGGSPRIVITPGQVDALAAAFTRTWQRPPTDVELKIQIDEYVREEMATREAMAIGLDRDDTVIRRRLRQKLEFLAEDSLEAAPPTDAELQAWLDTHQDAFRGEPEIAFRQVYLNPQVRKASLDADTRQLTDRLSRGAADAPIEALGDSVMLPRDVARTARSEVARQFGNAFADAVLAVTPGRWAGPIRSEYGVHLVYVSEREASHVPALAAVRGQVEREFMADRHQRQLDAMYARLLERYRVVVEPRGRK